MKGKMFEIGGQQVEALPLTLAQTFEIMSTDSGVHLPVLEPAPGGGVQFKRDAHGEKVRQKRSASILDIVPVLPGGWFSSPDDPDAPRTAHLDAGVKVLRLALRGSDLGKREDLLAVVTIPEAAAVVSWVIEQAGAVIKAEAKSGEC